MLKTQFHNLSEYCKYMDDVISLLMLGELMLASWGSLCLLGTRIDGRLYLLSNSGLENPILACRKIFHSWKLGAKNCIIKFTGNVLKFFGQKGNSFCCLLSVSIYSTPKTNNHLKTAVCKYYEWLEENGLILRHGYLPSNS